MPTTNISLIFSSDDGTAELFDAISGPLSGFPTEGTYDGSDGNPSGSVTFVMNAVADGTQVYGYTQTLEDWGVPAGSSITNISLLTVDAKGDTTGTDFDYYPAAALFLESPVSLWPSYKWGGAAWNGDHAWAALTTEDGDTITYPIASTVELTVQLEADAEVFFSDSHQVWFDNLLFSITYTAAADSTGTGALQAQDAVVSGTGTVKTIHRGTGALQAQTATIAGYAQSLPPGEVASRAQTANTYILLVDGVQVPLINFTVRRDTAAETARIVSPVIFEAEIAAASAIVINMQATDIHGATTVTQLFSGTVDSYSTSGYLATGNCVGAASWPANTVRNFSDVSFIRNDEAVVAYRLAVDPLFNPGDVGMYGLQRINVNRVVFSVTETQAFMELSDLGQM